MPGWNPGEWDQQGATGSGRSADRLCPGHAVEEEGERDEEAGQRTGGPDVDRRVLVPDRVLDADQGAEGADEIEERRRQEVGERRREAVTAAHDVMAELVGSEDEQKRDRERQPVREGAPSEHPPVFGEGPARDRRREKRGDEESQVKEGVLRVAKPQQAPSARRGRFGPLKTPAIFHSARVSHVATPRNSPRAAIER